jgi:hypothetical protein
VHRERLAELLWPDRAADAAANNLNQALYAARRALDAAGGDGAAALTLIDGAVVLNAQVDVDAFEAAAARARKDRDPAVYEWALSLHGGDLLPEDRYEPWADARRAALTELHTALCLELAELHGDAPAAVVALQRALVADPLAEPAHCALMRLYSRVIVSGTACSLRFGAPKSRPGPGAPRRGPTRDNRRCIEACSSVPGPGAFPRRRGHLWTAATIALAGRPSEPESPRIHGNPRLSPRFQALVPETERDRGRSTAIPETRNPHTCRVFEAIELRGLEPPTC